MAILKKSRKRTPLAEGQIYQSWGISHHNSGDIASFRLMIYSDEETSTGKTTTYTLNMTERETELFAIYYAQFSTREPAKDFSGLYAKKTNAQALRDLADKIEGK